MPGNVDEVGPVGNNLDTLRDQAIDDRAHRLLVAGNGARGKDDAVALVQRHLRVIVIGNARQRRARFALTARAKRQDLVRWEVAVKIGASESLDAIEITGFARDL